MNHDKKRHCVFLIKRRVASSRPEKSDKWVKVTRSTSRSNVPHQCLDEMSNEFKCGGLVINHSRSLRLAF